MLELRLVACNFQVARHTGFPHACRHPAVLLKDACRLHRQADPSGHQTEPLRHPTHFQTPVRHSIAALPAEDEHILPESLTSDDLLEHPSALEDLLG